MKSKTIHYLSIFIFALILGACSDNDEITPTPPGPTGPTDPTNMTDTEFTNRWIHDVMGRVYYWNESMPASPNYTPDSEEFFYGLLSSQDRFSWIEAEENSERSLKSLHGNTDLGFDYIPTSYFERNEEGISSSIGMFVIWVKEGSDAEAKGLKRGNVIYAVNNIDVNYSNYKTILNNASILNLSVYDRQGVQTTLPTIQKGSTGEDSPVVVSKVLNVGGMRIGYLMYNEFERGIGTGADAYKYDIELIQTIASMANQGITEFVLDLRYNLGGYLTSAMDLASALVPNRSTSNIFLKEKYNSYFQDSLVAKYGADALNEYFLDKVYGTSVDIPQLNLNRLYVLATGYSASASEAVMHGLKPYMEVYHIGETTVGKDQASMTIHANNSRIKWQLQPIISKLRNANDEGDYTNGLRPTVEVLEMNEGYLMAQAYYNDDNGNRVETEVPVLYPWKGGYQDLGDPQEPLLAAAIAHMTGASTLKAAQSPILINGQVKRVPFIKRDESRFRTIMDSDKFESAK